MADSGFKEIGLEEGIELALEYPVANNSSGRVEGPYCGYLAPDRTTWCTMRKGHEGKVHVAHFVRNDAPRRNQVSAWRVAMRWFG